MSLSIGIDLSDDYTAVRKDSGQEVAVIPTVICREKKSEEWHAGEDAFRTALSGRGVLTDRLLKLLRKGSVNENKEDGSWQFSKARELLLQPR